MFKFNQFLNEAVEQKDKRSNPISVLPKDLSASDKKMLLNILDTVHITGGGYGAYGERPIQDPKTITVFDATLYTLLKKAKLTPREIGAFYDTKPGRWWGNDWDEQVRQWNSPQPMSYFINSFRALEKNDDYKEYLDMFDHLPHK